MFEQSHEESWMEEFMKCGNFAPKLSEQEQSSFKSKSMMNDNMVTFLCYHFINSKLPLLKNLQGHRNPYLIPSLFFNKLTSNGTRMRDTNFIKEQSVEIALNWNLKLPNKDFVLIIVNQSSSHWVLYVLLEPLKPIVGLPLLFIFDPMNQATESANAFNFYSFKSIQTFFNVYADVHKLETNVSDRSCLICNVPPQVPEDLMCGLHVCLYVDKFFHHPMNRDAILLEVLQEFEKHPNNRSMRTTVMADVTSTHVEIIWEYLIKKFRW